MGQRVIGPKRDRVRVDERKRKLRNEKSVQEGGGGNVAHMAEERNIYRFSVVKTEGSNRLSDRGMYKIIKLKWV
jgi:hypothetical protein